MRPIQRLAQATVLATFLLIVLGAILRVVGPAAACPDWPTCQGQIIPPFAPEPLIDFSHRLVTSIVSALVVLTALYAWLRHRQEPWLLIPSLIAIVLLAVQIALGAFTVTSSLAPAIVTAHLVMALILFGTVTIVAASARWVGDPRRHPTFDGFTILALVTASLTAGEVLAGALVTAGGTTCASWPLCGNGFQIPSDGLASASVAHRILAGLVTLSFLALVLRARWTRPGDRTLHQTAFSGLGLLLVQIALGAGLVRWPGLLYLVPLHLAVTTAFWGDLIALAVLAGFPLVRADQVPAEASSPVPARSSWRDAARAYVNLTKPAIIVELLITTLGGMVMAARGLPPLGIVLATLIGGAAAAGGANAINCYLDRDIDSLMRRTRRRALPRGRIDPENALLFGMLLGGLSFIVLNTFTNSLSALLALAGLLFYVLIYTRLLKRSTPQNIVIGGAAGSLPPVVGWAAVTGRIDLLPLYLFAVIFFWTPPHFWALSLLTTQDYAQARVPMLPLVVGEDETRRQILLYSILLVAVTMLAASSRTLGFIYLPSALALGGGLIYYAVRLVRERSNARARQLFNYSNLYLALLFAAMAIDRVVPIAI
jgi:protoheme IX farnesyltransferase